MTTANVMPGSGHLMSGQTYYMKLRDGKTVEDIAFEWKDGTALGGMKMANGTNPMGGQRLSRHAREISLAGARELRRGQGLFAMATARSATLPRMRCARCFRATGWSTSTPTAPTTS